jgi:hypothetical protein
LGYFSNVTVSRPEFPREAQVLKSAIFGFRWKKNVVVKSTRPGFDRTGMVDALFVFAIVAE